MSTITINITNLIGTMVIIGDSEKASAKIQKNVADALLKALKSITESKIDPSRAESCNQAKE